MTIGGKKYILAIETSCDETSAAVLAFPPSKLKAVSYKLNKTRPMMSDIWTAPNSRESELLERLSPKTR